MPQRLRAGFLALAFLAAAPCAAADEQPDCAAIGDDGARLRCYDEADRRKAEAGTGFPYLVRTWNLGKTDTAGIGSIEAYQPTYFLFWRKTNDTNTLPNSPAPDHAVTAPQDIDETEAKFQLSFKTEVVRRTPIDFAPVNALGVSGLRVWAAYTQQSSWQFYNTRNSRPFRETDYEPELIATFDRNVGSAGLKLVNIGMVHQSNGRADPLSRSWNRAYAQGGWEWPSYRLSLLARVWSRLDGGSNDDNPNILKYMGHGDLVGHWEHGDNCSSDESRKSCQTVRILVRPNPGRSFVQIDWATGWGVELARFHIQVTSGYGESLIDYNFAQTTFGFGISIGDW